MSNSSDSDQTVQAVRLRKTQQMHQSKNMIGETRCICVMFPDIQVAFVVQQSMNHGSLAAANRGVAEYELSE